MSTTLPKRIGAVKVVDLYCGIGGLSHGLVLEGLNVVAGVDNDRSCKFAFEENNSARFVAKDIARFTSADLDNLYEDAEIRVLVGCAPCQPFSSLNRKRLSKRQQRKRWYPLYRFMNLIRSVQPEIISMENVPELSNEEKYPVFSELLNLLRRLKYQVSFSTVDTSRYGVPQRRKRLVLLASKLGAISLVEETHTDENLVTVRDVIKGLPRLKQGGICANDSLHRASSLSELNRKRIASTPRDGGSAKSWAKSLRPSCYKKETGHSYMCTVYGRMRWTEPAPTMTTQCTTLGTGRFGHPTQNRAISLREAAVFQSFPTSYKFVEGNDVPIRQTAKHIGNAVPVLLGRAIGKSIRQHIDRFG